jgi:hypothetical protein
MSLQVAAPHRLGEYTFSRQESRVSRIVTNDEQPQRGSNGDNKFTV